MAPDGKTLIGGAVPFRMRGPALLGLLLVVAAILAPPAAPQGPAQAWIWSPPGDDAQTLLAGLDWLSEASLPAHRYANLDLAAFEATPGQAERFLDRFGGRLDPNGRAELHLDRSLPYIEATEVKREVGTVRGGPSVLVVDTGVDSAHPDFQSGNMAANVQPERAGSLVVGSLEQIPVVDLAGHGTHVAGIVAGSGASLGASDPLRGKYTGVYSVGRFVSYQASTVGGDEEDIGVDIVAALEAFDWALANQERFDIRVVSNSWGDVGGFDPDHPVNEATLRLYLRGMVVAFSAGNDGEDGPGTLNMYCQAPWVLCVAAGDLDGARVGFSSYGRAAPQGEAWEHPDLTAPGLTIHAPKPMSDLSPTRTLTGLAGGGDLSAELYVDRSGTSMAAPHVAGAAALLLAERPDLSPDQVMDVLTATARPMADEVRKVGAGYLNVRRADVLAGTVEGNLDAFLAGDEVKYAGPATGDRAYANDPVTVGYDGAVPPSALTLPGRDRPWLAEPLAWVLLGAAALLAGVGTVVRLR